MSLVRHSTYNLIGGIIPVITALITVPLYVHLIGPARYGVLSIAWILLGYFGLFDLGLGRATSFRIASLVGASSEDRADTFWTAVFVNVGMGAVGGVLLWVAGHFFFAHVFKVSSALRPEILAAVPLLAASVPIATLTGVLTGGMQGRQKFLGINVVSVISSTLFQVFPLVVALTFGPNLIRVLGAAILARLVGLLVLAYLCHRELVRGHPIRVKRSEVPLLLRYGGWITVGSLIAPLLTVVDRFVIGGTVGAVAVAIYTIPFQLAKQVAVLPAAINTAFFPRIAAATPAERKQLERDAIFVILSLVSLPVLGAIFLSESILLLWVGHRIGEQAAPIARVLFVTFWLNALALVPLNNLTATGRPEQVVKYQSWQIIPYLVALYFALKWFGIFGAALAFLFRLMMDYGLLSWGNNRRFPGFAVLALNFVILIAGAYVASLWNIEDWRWWISAVALGLLMLTLGLRTLPASFQLELRRRANAFRFREAS